MSKTSFSAVLILVLFCSVDALGAVVERSISDLAAEAPKIVMGDVTEVSSYWAEDGIIRSHVVVQVSDYLVGQGTGAETLDIAGGTIGDTTLHVSIFPVFQAGDHVLLFLHEGGSRLVQAFQGAYLADGQQIVRMAPACGRMIEESLQPLTEALAEMDQALPPGTFLYPAPYAGGFTLPLGQPRYELCGRSWAYKANPMGENYVINANCADASAGDAASQRTQIQKGPAAWNNAGADFEFTYGGTSSGTSMTYNGVNLVFFSMDPPEGGEYVAAAFTWSSNGDITEVDLVFNDRDYTWWNGEGTCPSAMDIWNIATHEFGHWLCLADLYGGGDTAKTMYGYTYNCDLHARDLHSDDINGIIAIYGVPPGPENDLCADATPVGNGTYTGNTSIAYNDGSASCGSSTTTKDVWYKYVPSASGTLIIDTCGSSYNTVLSIHTGCPGTGANQVGGSSGCNDNSNNCGSGSQQSYLSLSVTAYTVYYIRVSGYSGASGAYTLNVSGPAPDSTAPTPNPMTFNASPSGAPSATSTSQITMTATQASDSSGVVDYYFTASGAGSHSSDWQSSRTYTDSGLATNQTYTYMVKARDAMRNETASSAAAAAATFIETPTGLSFGTITDTTIQVTAPGTFTRLTDNLSGLYFEVTTLGGTPVGGAQANAWVQTQTITAIGLSPGTTYRFRVKARNYYGLNETAWYPTSSYVEQATGTADLTPPSPNPMTFNADPNGAPVPISISQITMTATEATDPSGGIQYYFTATGAGSASSGWQTSRTYTNGSLQINRNYSYKVKARDALLNETTDSTTVAVATFIETPTALTFGTITDDSIVVNAPGTFTRLASSSSGLYYEVLDPGNNPVGGSQANTWVKLQTITAGGLSPGTTYRFRVKARNYFGENETPWYPTAGYLNQATTGGATCSLLGDMNQDSVINALDIGGFIRAKLGGSMEPGENAACAEYGGTLQEDIADFVDDLLD